MVAKQILLDKNLKMFKLRVVVRRIEEFSMILFISIYAVGALASIPAMVRYFKREEPEWVPYSKSPADEKFFFGIVVFLSVTLLWWLLLGFNIKDLFNRLVKKMSSSSAA